MTEDLTMNVLFKKKKDMLILGNLNPCIPFFMYEKSVPPVWCAFWFLVRGDLLQKVNKSFLFIFINSITLVGAFRDQHILSVQNNRNITQAEQMNPIIPYWYHLLNPLQCV